jgi:competence protein ComEA
MFGRQTPLDRDTVSAAHRRLAAIAAQFAAADGGPGSVDDDDVGLDDRDVTAAADRLSADQTAPDSANGAPVTSRDPEGSPRRAAQPARHLVRPRSVVHNRLSMSPHHVAVISLAAIVMIALAAWWVLRSAPHTQPVQLSSERTLPSSTAPSVAAASSTGNAPPGATPSGVAPAAPTAPVSGSVSGSVVVDVAGRVRRPGIVELPAGSRVADALRAAGGARPGTRTSLLNLARPLVDGEQIVVGLHVPAMPSDPTAAATGTPSAGASIAPVNLNSATAEQLDTLPGIGPVTAQAILTWRTENGRFTSVDELLEVSGIGDATLADIAPYVYV